MRVFEFRYQDDVHVNLKLRHQVIILIGAALGLACGFGPVFVGTAGIFLKPIADSFNWSRADVAFLPMLGLIGSAIGAPIIGFIADRVGWRKVIAFSIMFFSLGLLAMSVAPQSRAYIVVIGVLTGIAGAATTAAGYTSVIALVFERRLGLALGLAMIGVGVGATTAPIIAGQLLEHLDWRQAYACFGISCLLLGLIAHQLIFHVLGVNQTRSGSVSGKAANDSDRIIQAGEGLSLSQAIGSYRFWLMVIVVTLVACPLLGVYIHLASYVSDRGISPAIAAQSVGLWGLGMTLARVGVGFVLDRVFAPLVACGVLLLGAAGFYLLTADILESAWILSLAAILIGFSSGAEGDLIPFLVRKYFGVRALGSIYGALLGVYAISSALGTFAYGLSFDLLKSYTPVLQVSVMLLGACSLAILTLGRYQFPLSMNMHNAILNRQSA